MFEITITEGRNRQVRRMVEALGGTVLKLVRTAIGPIEIAGLKIGAARALTDAEVRALSGVERASSPRPGTRAGSPRYTKGRKS